MCSATELSIETLRRPSPDVPTANPTATRTIADVMPRRSSGPETAPYTTRITEMVSTATRAFPSSVGLALRAAQ